MNREPIAAALLAKLSGLSTVVSASRVLRHVSDMQPSECPALFLVPQRYPTSRATNLPAKRMLDYVLYVYTRRASREEVPDTQINAVLDQIEAARARGRHPEPDPRRSVRLVPHRGRH
jgi:hypothetical protein